MAETSGLLNRRGVKPSESSNLSSSATAQENGFRHLIELSGARAGEIRKTEAVYKTSLRVLVAESGEEVLSEDELAERNLRLET